eukprot:CAMPEP_0204597708 /NCGR_PEP_ID=MMETSP0661-20131031/53944_1 /ASSEMBLY_ACC=CAM_ASM_000606 /TAXON_ID=109239 /ORGANISM="Alexandrium margalefi, Strain AMGDE01CS-322" /LENGTH=281 /DNA_ID=CAMNT_0051608405 /DNA_START=11 /DNA_END=856 /DNA_ORIENTATION=-
MPRGPRARCTWPLALSLALCPRCNVADASGRLVGAAFRQLPLADAGDQGAAVLARVQTLGAQTLASLAAASLAAGQAAEAARGLDAVAAEGAPAVAAANASLQRAIAAHDKAKTLINGVEQRAYVAAKRAAEEVARRVEKQAVEDYDSAVTVSRGPSKSKSRLRAKAAAKAAKPYNEAGDRIQAMVDHYSGQVQDWVEEAQILAGRAAAATKAAGVAQAQRDPLLAGQEMAKARGFEASAGDRRARALKLRRVVESLHSYIPSYRQAAEMAAERVSAVGTT